jgi:hypothetical protein
MYCVERGRIDAAGGTVTVRQMVMVASWTP